MAENVCDHLLFRSFWDIITLERFYIVLSILRDFELGGNIAMHKLVINKLGPIQYCELTCSDIMAFTGFQASGKSTIAKAIYYFRTIKDDICRIAEEKALEQYSQKDQNIISDLRNTLISFLRDKFLRVFGSSWGMDNEMYLEYHYTKECNIRITLKESTAFQTPNYIWIDLSKTLVRYLDQHNSYFSVDALGVPKAQKQKMNSELSELFDDSYEIVYIPAGRSLLTLFSQQLSFIYTTMKETQKRLLDYCTQNYIERILSLKPEFSNGFEGLIAFDGTDKKYSIDTIRLAFDLIEKILRGSYRFVEGEERIVLKNHRYVKLNYASSGQQESVWILNLILYYLIRNKPVLFIIEEPESHLFPESQKYITELIALAGNSGNSIIITTHSPYVLGTMNNLLFANRIPAENIDKANKLIPQKVWIDYNRLSAWFVSDGTVEECLDPELQLIQNEKIDGISQVINQEFDSLLEMQTSV